MATSSHRRARTGGVVLLLALALPALPGAAGLLSGSASAVTVTTASPTARPVAPRASTTPAPSTRPATPRPAATRTTSRPIATRTAATRTAATRTPMAAPTDRTPTPTDSPPAPTPSALALIATRSAAARPVSTAMDPLLKAEVTVLGAALLLGAAGITGLYLTRRR